MVPVQTHKKNEISTWSWGKLVVVRTSMNGKKTQELGNKNTEL